MADTTTSVPGPGVQQVLQHRQRLDVEVVGRLVEQQHVGPVDQQAQQLQAAPLATGQVAEPRPQPLAGEPEALEQLLRGELRPLPTLDVRADLLAATAARGPPGPARPGPGDEPGRLTTVVPTADACPRPRRRAAVQQPQQRRLARPVGPEQPDPVARAEPPGDAACSTAGGPAPARSESRPRGRRPACRAGRSANRCSANGSRGGGSSAISSLAASMRNFGLLVRAGGPRRSHASSLRSRFCRRSSVDGRQPRALGLGQHVGRVAAVVGVDLALGDLPGLRGRPRRGTTGRASRPRARRARHGAGARRASPPPRRRGGWWARPAAAGRGRRRAAARQRDPAPLAPGHACRPRCRDRRGSRTPSTPPSKAVSTSRIRGVAGPLVRRRGRPTTHVAQGRPPGRARRPARSSAHLHAAGARDPAGVGGPRPASVRSSVVLPPPLRPTTPTRAPSVMPTGRPSSSVRVPRPS